MPCSTKGVLKHRSLPYFCCRLLVARNTPPNTPTSSPKQSTRSLAAIAISRALLMACSMFILAMLNPLSGVASRLWILIRIPVYVCLKFFKLRAQRGRHFVIYVGYQRFQRRWRALLSPLHGFQNLMAQPLLKFFFLAVTPPFPFL